MNAIGLRYNPEPPEASDLSAEYDRREREIWADPELVSEAMQSLDCLEVRGRRSGSYELPVFAETGEQIGTRLCIYNHPPVNTGLPAVEALRSGDFAELGRLIHAEVTKVIRQRAEDEVDEENDR